MTIPRRFYLSPVTRTTRVSSTRAQQGFLNFPPKTVLAISIDQSEGSMSTEFAGTVRAALCSHGKESTLKVRDQALLSMHTRYTHIQQCLIIYLLVPRLLTGSWKSRTWTRTRTRTRTWTRTRTHPKFRKMPFSVEDRS